MTQRLSAEDRKKILLIAGIALIVVALLATASILVDRFVIDRSHASYDIIDNMLDTVLGPYEESLNGVEQEAGAPAVSLAALRIQLAVAENYSMHLFTGEEACVRVEKVTADNTTVHYYSFDGEEYGSFADKTFIETAENIYVIDHETNNKTVYYPTASTYEALREALNSYRPENRCEMASYTREVSYREGALESADILYGEEGAVLLISANGFYERVGGKLLHLTFSDSDTLAKIPDDKKCEVAP